MTLEPRTGGEPDERDVEGLVDDLHHKHGYDFRHYSKASRRRRVEALIVSERTGSVAGLRRLLAEDPAAVVRFVQALSVPATAMFRDPEVFLALRTRVLPVLATYPSVRIWLAGCATGEEAWSFAIMLEEEGLYDRARIYATDMSPLALERARAGIFPIAMMRDYTQNYQRAGGGDFSRHYTAAYDGAKFDAGLRRNIVFAQHNLAVDDSFNEFHLVCCRNVLIYFDQDLQRRAHRLLHASLADLGLLCLGAKESPPPGVSSWYESFDPACRIYRKLPGAVAPEATA